MTTPSSLFSVRPGQVLDFVPAFERLQSLDHLARLDGYEAVAAWLLDGGFSGEPVPRGADPVTRALNHSLSADARVAVWGEVLQLQWQKTPDSLLPLGRLDLIDYYPGVVGFLYCLEDLRFLELSPPRRPQNPGLGL